MIRWKGGSTQLISHESLAGYMAFRGHTVRTLAKQVGVSHALIGSRSGHRRSCSPRTARAIAERSTAPSRRCSSRESSTVSRETAPSPRKAA